MSLHNKRLEIFGWEVTLAVARTKLANGGVRYSQRVELQRSGDQ